jgi:hypothetical protein
MARRAVAYSRISRTGLPISCPYHGPTVWRWLTPIPSSSRPPENSSIVAAVWAVATGVREYMGRTPVPRRIRSLAAA